MSKSALKQLTDVGRGAFFLERHGVIAFFCKYSRLLRDRLRQEKGHEDIGTGCVGGEKFYRIRLMRICKIIEFYIFV